MHALRKRELINNYNSVDMSSLKSQTHLVSVISSNEVRLYK